jgi:hypothetical protein
VRLALHSASELSAQVAAARSAAAKSSPAAGDDEDGAAAAAGGLESQLALYDKVINNYSEARAAVRALIRANASGEGGAGSQGQAEELVGLEKALSGKLIEETLERGQLQVAEVQRRWEALQVKLSEGKKVRDR